MEKVVITGATQGIGKAIACKYAKEGYDVAICARSEEQLVLTVQEIKLLAPNANIIYRSCDVANADERKAFTDFVLQHFGSVDILVNNAGVYMPGQINSEDEGVLEKTIETNLYSAYDFSRKFLPGMMERKKGHIFNMCSTASITPYTNGGSYCISKYAMYGMTKVLREEMKEYDVKVTAILPGATLTRSWEGTEFPPERFMQAEDVAEAVYMASKLSPSAVIEEILMRPMLGDIG